MRVLFLESHEVWVNGLPNGFRDAGHKVLVSGPLTKRNLPKMICEFRPHLMIAVGAANETGVDKQLLMRKWARRTGTPLMYWATEDPEYTQHWSLPTINRMNASFVFTICPSMVEMYEKQGIPAAHLPYGFHSQVHHRVPVVNSYQCSIAVVANAYPLLITHYPDFYRLELLKLLIQPLLKENIRIDFWGTQWDQMGSYLDFEIPREWIHGYLPYTEANKVYSSADIVIGLQNYTTQLTQRTFEVLGSEGFLLTADTPEVRRLFTPDKDLIVSSTPEETLSKVRYYLEHPELREQIRKQGRITVESHSYRYRAESIITTLQERRILTKTRRSEQKKRIKKWTIYLKSKKRY